MYLDDKEKGILADREFLITKINIIEKIHSLFENVRVDLKQAILTSQFNFDYRIDTEYGKIFKGEDYKSLPYVVLDYPKFFSKKGIFAFRTMLWWGNFFSATLHLEGDLFTKYKDRIIKNSKLLFDGETYFCINTTPWEYHYSNDNYIIINKDTQNKLDGLNFLKLSKKFNLDQYDQIPRLSSDFLEHCLKVIADD
jgi:hypothetical protein